MPVMPVMPGFKQSVERAAVRLGMTEVRGALPFAFWNAPPRTGASCCNTFLRLLSSTRSSL
jgi:hypothetical protein